MKAETLKKAILQYAMQGKLVEQDPNDEPASVLLERIKAEKEQLIKDGKIKKEKPLPPISEDEIPFQVPDSWEWVKFGDLVNYNIGRTPSRKEPVYWGNDIPWISIADMIDMGYINTTKEKISKYAFEKCFKEQIIPKDTLIMSFKLTVGKVSILGINALHNEAIISIFPYQDQNFSIRNYLFHFLPLIAQTGNTKSAIKGNTLNTESINNLIVPLPPLAEQERIVDMLEQILPLVEEYGKNEEKLSKLNSTLPDKIKQSILQHAVQGKLVPQNSDDEPASELLKRIKAEKEQLLKDGKIKKEKPLPPITEDEIPFQIPDSWEWVRLRDICEILNGYAFKSDSYVTKSNNQIIRLGNVKNNGLALETSPVYIPDTIAKNAVNYLLKENDILITLTGTRLKRDYFYTALVKRNDIEQFNLYLNQRVGCLRFYSDVNPKLLNIFLKSKLILDNIFEHETGTANQGNIGTGATGELLIPLPPLAEQQHIVTKVEELLSTVDSLKG